MNNYASTITAGYDLTINNNTISTGEVQTSTTIQNTGITLNRTVGTTGSSYLYGEFSCGFMGMVTCEHAATLTVPPTSKLTALSTIPSSITAGNGLHMHAGVVTNTTIGGTQTSNPASSNSSGVISVPTSGLYTIQPQPGSNYLVVTDSRFTDYQNFISSDYMLARLSLDPLYTQKRLGDGFYEQKLINDQVTQLTGRRFIPPYANAQDEIKALMDAGIAAANELKLVPGLTLTKEQIAALTTDILWLVEEKVALPNGETTKVLVPKVYLSSLHTADLKPNGALIAADAINLNATGTLANSGRIKGNTSVMLAANDIFNKNGSIGSLGELTLKAGNDIRNESGRIGGRDTKLTAGHDILNTTLTQTIQYGDNSLGASNTLVSDTGAITATGNLGLDAGNDITVSGANVETGGDATLNAGGSLTVGTVVEEAAATVNSSNFHYNTQQITNHASSIKTGGNLTLVSGNDMHLTSATVEVGKDATLVTGGDLTIDAAKDSYRKSLTTTGKDDFYAAEKRYDETVLGSTLIAGGNVTLAATRLNADAVTQVSSGDGIPARADGKGNITLQSAAITSNTGKVTVAADANIDIGVTEEEHSTYRELHTQTSGLTTTTQRTTRDETWRTDTIGSSLSGDSVSIASGKDINITGSSASAEHDIQVAAMGDVNIAASTDTYGSDHYDHESTSGWQIKDAFNITNHGPETTNKARTDGTNQSFNRSSLSSKQGNLSILAGGNLIASGTDLTADKGELALTAGGTIALLAGQDTLNQSSSSETITQDNIITKQRHTITDTSASLDYLGSTLNGKSVTINSGADTILQATDVKAGQGGITIDAGGDLKLLAAANQHSTTHTETLSTDGFTFRADGSLNDTDTRRMNNKRDEQTLTNLVTRLVSGGDITTHSGGDTRIEASTLDAAGSIDLSATGYAAAYNEDGSLKYEGRQGTIAFAAVKDTHYLNEVNSSNSMPWQSSNGYGEVVDTLKLANIKSGKGLAVDAQGGIIVDIPEVSKEAPAPVEPEEPLPTTGADGKPLTPAQIDTLKAERAARAAEKAAQVEAARKAREEQRLNDHINQLAGKPGQEWIGQLARMAKEQPDSVKLQQVNAALEKWDYRHDGLTSEATAVIAIVIAYFTAGAGSSVVGTTATGATATTAGVVTAAVVQAAVTTLATQATVGLINNGGNVGKTLDDMGKSENVKALVTAMVTAGVLSGLSQTLTLGEGNTSFNNINAKSGFTLQLEKNLINNATSAVINHAINGGDFRQQLEQSLRGALIDTGAAQAANEIGDMKGKELNNFTHKVAHAVAGCAIGAVKADNCGAGALGAVVGELSAEWYGGNRTNASINQPGFQTDTVNFAKMMAGIAVAITGGDAEAINLAASTGGNAAENNFLGHVSKSERDRLRAELEKKGTLSAADADKLVILENADQVSDELLNKWKSNPDSLSANEKVALAGYLNVYANQDGPEKFKQIMGPQAKLTGAFSNYDFPYAGSQEAKDAYLTAHPYPSGWRDYIFGREKTDGESTYYKAETVLSVYGYHQQWADVGTPALFAVPGAIGTLASLTMVAGGSYQAGQGYAAYKDGDRGTGALNMGLGTLAVFGGVVGVSAATGGFKSVGGGANGAAALLESEASALQRIAANNRAGSPWADLRSAYQQAKGQVDFAHIESDLVFNSSGVLQKAQGGHFSTSPLVDIIPGTESVGTNGTIWAKVNMLGPDGNWYLKTNNKGFSSLTPDFWSLAQAKGEMSQAFLGRTQLPNGNWMGSSSGVDFRFYSPTKNVPLWRGFPEYKP